MSVRRPFSPPLHSAAHYTRKHLQAGQRAAPPNHAEWADAKRVRSISTVRFVRFEPLGRLFYLPIIAAQDSGSLAGGIGVNATGSMAWVRKTRGHRRRDS